MNYRWKCVLCGEIVISKSCPKECPLCLAGEDSFVCLGPVEEEKKQEVAATVSSAQKKFFKWMCTICGEIVISDVAPDVCGPCGAGKELFVCIGTAENPNKANDSEKKLMKWLCTVCGEIIISETCPNECGLCGAGKEFFQCIGPADAPTPKIATAAGSSETGTPAQKKWKCTVCGEAIKEESPSACPLCGAGKELLVFEVPSDCGCGQLFGLDTFEGKVLIVGAGGAGIAAMKAIREKNKKCQVTVVSTEPYKPYSRPALVRMLTPEMIEKAKLLPDAWYGENKVELLLSTKVESVDYAKKEAKIVSQEKGAFTYHFDKLILATGGFTASPMPDCLDKKLTNVFGVRGIDDIKAIGKYINDFKPKTCALIGGGLTCLEMAEALHKVGIISHIIEYAPTILPNQLAEMGSKLFTQTLEENQVITHTNIRTKSLARNEDGTKATGVITDCGVSINADFFLYSVGTRPILDLAKSIEGLKLSNGIVIDSHCETNLPGVFSCGDCAEYEGKIMPNWTVATEQGRICGLNCLKPASAENWACYKPEPSPYAMCCFTTVFSCGDRKGDENVVIKRGCNMIELWFKNQELCGVVMVGKEVGTFTQDLKTAIKEKKSFKQVMSFL